jgi:phosphopantothenate synthetase
MKLNLVIITVLMCCGLMACNDMSKQEARQRRDDSIRIADSIVRASEEQRIIDSVNRVTNEQKIIADSILMQFDN